MKAREVVVLAVLFSAVFAQAQDRNKESKFAPGERERVRKHLVQKDADYPYPWFDPVPRIYDVSASPEDPQMYLGKPVRYEWQGEEYPPELLAEVEGLTFGLTDDYAKLTAIADRVKHSKSYATTLYTLWPPSIADIWRTPTGVCADSALELAAMLRSAGIPAVTFDSWSRWHTAVRAYVGGKWVIADATSDILDNSGPARIYDSNDPSFVAAFQERPLGTLRDVMIPGTDGQKVDYFTFFAYETMAGERDKYKGIGLDLAELAFPVTNEFLYYDPVTRTFTKDKSKQKVHIFYRIDGQDNFCLNDRGSWYANSLKFIVPGILWRTVGYNRESSYVSTLYPRGYIVTSLPTCGSFRVIYSFNNGDLNSSQDTQALAYAEVQLYSGGGVTVVTPQDLQPLPGTDIYYFTALVKTLSNLPSYEQLGGKQ
jgi:hypothetical protein